METQSQKYSGNNFYNNAITIDFDKRNVEFTPVIRGEGSVIRYYITFLLNIVEAAIYPAAIGLGSIILLGMILRMNSYYAETVFIILGGITIIGISLLYFNKKWRNDKFSKFMFTISLLGHKKKTITPDMINNKTFIFPFKNVGLKYKLYGDFTKIRKIYIRNPFPKNDYTWLCYFEFKTQPKVGKMKLTYV